MQQTVLMEITDSTQNKTMCKEELEILWKQLMEATTTNEEINFVRKTLKQTIDTVNALKINTSRPLVSMSIVTFFLFVSI
jgi:hypothetical protein